MMGVRVPTPEPDPHVLRIEQHVQRQDRVATYYDVSAWLDDKPLSRVRSIDISYAAEEIVMATITMELRGVEIPEGAAVLRVECVEE